MIFLLIFLNGVFISNIRSDTDVNGKLFGVGVCSIHRTDTKSVLILQTRFYPEMSFTLCWNMPPWCKTPTGRELKEFVTVPTAIRHDILLLKCCSGYYSSLDGLHCIPSCSPLCLPDKCFSPNNCSECKQGYHSSFCVKNSSATPYFFPISDSSANVTTASISSPVCACQNNNFMCNDRLECVCARGFDGPTCQPIIPHEIIIDSDSCSHYAVKVCALLSAMAASAVLLAILLKKRVLFSTNLFEPLDDRNVPYV